MNFEDVAWLEVLFEKIKAVIEKAETKEEIIDIIGKRHAKIREIQLNMAEDLLQIE